MEAVKSIMDSGIIGTVIQLPVSFRNKKVEVIVMPVDSDEVATQPNRKISLSEIDAGIKNSIVGTLRGVLSNTDTNITASDIRAERLAKYESPL
jgi:hypothetical protein